MDSESRTVYVKRFIKTADDLPKDGKYIAHYKRCSDDSPAGVVLTDISSYNTDQLNNWLNHIDWYMEPVEMPTEEEQMIYFCNHSNCYAENMGYVNVPAMTRSEVLKFANWLLSRLK
jgi:hypothetical protein